MSNAKNDEVAGCTIFFVMIIIVVLFSLLLNSCPKQFTNERFGEAITTTTRDVRTWWRSTDPANNVPNNKKEIENGDPSNNKK